MFDCGDVIYRSACKGVLQKLDVLYDSAIRFVTNAPFRTHHCTLYSSLHWPWSVPPSLASTLALCMPRIQHSLCKLDSVDSPKNKLYIRLVVLSVCCSHRLEGQKKAQAGFFFSPPSSAKYTSICRILVFTAKIHWYFSCVFRNVLVNVFT